MVTCLCPPWCFIWEHGVFLITRRVTANGVSGLRPLRSVLGIKVQRVTYGKENKFKKKSFHGNNSIIV